MKPPLLRRAGIGVSFYLVPLLIDYTPQFALHRFEGIVNRLVQRLMRTIIHLLLFRDQLVPRRYRHIDSDPVSISFLMSVIRLFDRYVAAIDMVAKLLQPRRIFQNQVVDFIGFFQTAIRDLNRQLHEYLNVKAESAVTEAYTFR
jgi:hypothetical protein